MERRESLWSDKKRKEKERPRKNHEGKRVKTEQGWCDRDR